MRLAQRGSPCPNCKEVHEKDVEHAGKLWTQIGWALQIDDCFWQHPMYKSRGVALSDTAASLACAQCCAGTLQSTHSAGTLVHGCCCLHTCLTACSLGFLFDCIACPQYIPALTALQCTDHSPFSLNCAAKRCKFLGWLVPLVQEEKDTLMTFRCMQALPPQTHLPAHHNNDK